MHNIDITVLFEEASMRPWHDATEYVTLRRSLR